MSKTNKNKKKQKGGGLFSFLIAVAVLGTAYLYHNLDISLNVNYLHVIAAVVIGFIFFMDFRTGLIIATIIGLVITNIPNSHEPPSMAPAVSAMYASET